MTRELLRQAIEKYLRDNDPEGFGCACEPNARAIERAHGIDFPQSTSKDLK